MNASHLVSCLNSTVTHSGSLLDGNADAQWDDFLFESDILDLLSNKPLSPLGKSNKKVVKSNASKSIKKVASADIISKMMATTKPMTETKLYSFPSFDKSSSMLYFPSTFARLLNSGELEELSRIVKSYCIKACEVKLHETFKVSVMQYVDLLSLSNVFHPDSVCCMHSTKVVDNQIKSVLYYKYTDVPEMYNYADMVVTDPAFKWVYVGKRRDILRRNLLLDDQSEENQRSIYDLIEKGVEVQVYGKFVMTLTFDQYSKKIVHVEYDYKYTSIAHRSIHYNLNE